MFIRSRAVFIWFKLGRAGLRSITGPYTAKSGIKCDRAAQSEWTLIKYRWDPGGSTIVDREDPHAIS